MSEGQTAVRRGRARSVEEFAAALGAALMGERPNHKPYEPKQGDVFITSWAKSGTTLMQQMFHQLRTGAKGGDLDFDDISRVTPWEDTAFITDFDMTAPQVASPRGFKSHREYGRLPEGMRYVVTLRDPKETFVSYFRFLNGWHFEPGSISYEEFMPVWMLGGPGGCEYAKHLVSWYERLHEADSLVLTYKWVVKHRAETIRKLAQLCDIELTPEIEALVLERTSREFMSSHEHLFDDAMVCAALEKHSGIPAAGDSTKVQKVGSSKDVLPDSVSEQIDAYWAERIAPATGHASFADLAAEVDALAAAE